MRQRDVGECTALAALRDGQPERYLEWASAAGRIEMLSDASDATRRATGLWHEAVADSGAAEVVIVARENDTRDELNAAGRELWGALGLLGEGRTYGGLALAVGDRVICRQNDARLDVDNGMRGCVRELNGPRVVIETDCGAVRELPAAYVGEHLEHAYALTGHAMQGSTVGRAIVVAKPRDLTAGWSYTALSRARSETSLLIVDDDGDERSEFAPAGSATPRDPLLTRVARKMRERDDEDLAVEQLHRGVGHNPEEAAEHAEPRIAARSRQRLEGLEARVATLRREQERVAVRLGRLAPPRRRFGRKRDRDSIERVHLASVLEGVKRELQIALDQHARLLRRWGDTSRVTPDHGLEREHAEITHRHEYIGAIRPERRLEPSREMKPNRDLDAGIER
jgi:hypothetical protein